MSSEYFSSIPPYNKFRFRALSVNRDDFVVYAVKLPVDLRPVFFGAFSVLLDFNSWEPTDTISQELMTEITNNDICWGEFCDFVADCIIENPLTHDAIADAIRNSSSIREAINAVSSTANHTTIVSNVAYSDATIIASNGDSNGCDDDSRFGRIKALVDYIDQVQLDFFETIDTAISILQEAENVYSAIPIAETLPIDELINIIATTGEQWRDSYEASVNTQLLEDFYCSLWCDLQGCDVTVSDIRDAILSRYNTDTTTGVLNVLNVVSLISRIAATVASAGGIAYIGDDFVFLSWLLQISAVELSGQFFGVSIVDYAQQASAGSPSSLWSSCVPCPSDYCLSFFGGTGSTVQNDATITTDDGDYNPATYDPPDLVGGEAVVNGVGVAVVIRFDNPDGITRIRGSVDWLARRSRFTLPEMEARIFDNNGNKLVSQRGDGQNIATTTAFDFDGLSLAGLPYIVLNIFAAQNTIGDGTYCNLTTLTIEGDGNQPDYGGVSC